jgi:isoleucyl-tRNA synthetase
MYPEVREEYFDPVVERQVKRMQAIIELTRVVRERRRIPVKKVRPSICLLDWI